MEPNAFGLNGANGAGGANAAGAANGGANAAGNNQLSQAFDRAIAEAQKTLQTTTIKGADLYALKQQVR